MMTSEEIYSAWAPTSSPWSLWAKPVLFASTPMFTGSGLPPFPRVDWAPRGRDTAVVIDSPGVDSVMIGLALLRAGYQPVPLYNCNAAAGMLVDVAPILRILDDAAVLIKSTALTAGAPPAFLLDSNRLANSTQATVPGRYDNRWCVLPQDMPSASRLKLAGIRQVLVFGQEVRDDLAHILKRYQDGGILVRQCRSERELPSDISVATPAKYKSLLYRLAVIVGLRRNSAGGFGALVPDYTTSGGGGFG